MMYTDEQINRANNTSLETFLRSRGEPLVRSGGEYRWKTHDSVTIRGNRWFRHSQAKGGYPPAFLMEFWQLTFPQAIELLIGEKPEGSGNNRLMKNSGSAGILCAENAADAGIADTFMPSEDSSGEQTASEENHLPFRHPDSVVEKAVLEENLTQFHLPVPAMDQSELQEYLCQNRGISPEVLEYFVNAGDVYLDSDRKHAVFVGRDKDGTPRYAFRRGIASTIKKDIAGSDKSYNFSYTGTGSRLCVFEAAIDLLSFLSLFPKNWNETSYLALGGVSGRALHHFLEDHPEIQTVYLCLDHDQAGDEACPRIAGELAPTYHVQRLLPVMKDWNLVLQHRRYLGTSPLYSVEKLGEDRPFSEENRVDMICLNDVEQTEVEWLWKPYIPFGKLTILQGNPGEGKTYFAMHLAAACTNRIPLPGMEAMEPFPVIYQTAEDGLGDTVKPRLLEAGADLTRVLTINDAETQLTLADSRIEDAIRQNRARLLIIDPIQAYLGANVDMNRANEVRPIFRALGDTAQRTGCAILLIGHLNKASGMQSTYRGLGSIDFTACVRSLLFIGKKKDDPNVRILAHEKSSLAPNGPSLAFMLGDEEGFRWLGECDWNADQMLGAAPTEKREDKRRQARELILSMLAGGRRVMSSEIDRAAMEKGISSRTVRDAKAALGTRLKSRITTGRLKEYWMEVSADE